MLKSLKLYYIIYNVLSDVTRRFEEQKTRSITILYYLVEIVKKRKKKKKDACCTFYTGRVHRNLIIIKTSQTVSLKFIDICAPVARTDAADLLYKHSTVQLYKIKLLLFFDVTYISFYSIEPRQAIRCQSEVKKKKINNKNKTKRDRQ